MFVKAAKGTELLLTSNRQRPYLQIGRAAGGLLVLSHYMRLHKLKFWLLLIYLVLLLNLGPSLHRADVLGFHQQGDSQVACNCGAQHALATKEAGKDLSLIHI